MAKRESDDKLLLLLSKVEARRPGAQGSHEVCLVGDLGLDIIRKPVGIVAWVHLAARHGPLALHGPHLLDVVVVLGADNGRDVKVGHVVPVVEVDLAEHARLVVLALLDGIEVSLPLLGREGNLGLFLAVHNYTRDRHIALTGSEVDSARRVVQGPESDGAGSDGSSRGKKSQSGGSEAHFD